MQRLRAEFAMGERHACGLLRSGGGWLAIPDEILATMSPYQTEHINRFGNYSLNLDRAPEPIALDFRKPPQSETACPVLVMPKTGSDQAH